MQLNILLVDDDNDDAELFCDGLIAADPDINCHAANNGKVALDLLKRIDLPELIFLDLNMPVMNGWECLKMLKSDDRYQNIPVLMYSTSSNQREVDMAEQSGAAGFITKPDDFKELKKILKTVSDRLRAGTLTDSFFRR